MHDGKRLRHWSHRYAIGKVNLLSSLASDSGKSPGRKEFCLSSEYLSVAAYIVTTKRVVFHFAPNEVRRVCWDLLVDLPIGIRFPQTLSHLLAWDGTTTWVSAHIVVDMYLNFERWAFLTQHQSGIASSFGCELFRERRTLAVRWLRAEWKDASNGS